MMFTLCSKLDYLVALIKIIENSTAFVSHKRFNQGIFGAKKAEDNRRKCRMRMRRSPAAITAD
jgi:hypothetical protein